MSSKKDNFSDEETEKISSEIDKQDESEIEDSDADSQITDYSCDYEEIVEGEEPVNIFELDDNYDGDNIVRGDARKSSNKMSRYEMVRILGERVKHLTLGAKCFIKNKEDFDYETLAMEELKAKLIPFKIIRRLPNNIKEEWSVDELYIEHLFI